MALTKPPVLPPWAEAGDKVQPTNAELQAGWPLSNVPPSRQRFNWLLNFLANGIRYLTRRGMPDYGADETYMIGDRVIGDDGKTYRSIQDNNINHAPSASPLWWEEWAPSLSRLADLLQKQAYTAFTTAGAAPNFTLTPAPAITAYAAGQRFRVKFHAAGTGADVMNVNALGNKSIKQYDTAGTKVAAVIAANQLADVEYDGVDFVLRDRLPPTTGPTPAQFDNSTKLATTAFMQRALGNFRSNQTINVSTVLTAADHLGSVILFNGAAGQSFTLPLAADCTSGGAIHFRNQSSNNLTIQRQGANYIVIGTSTSLTSFVLKPGETISFYTPTDSWYAIGGSATLPYETGLASTLAANGYQKLPSGLIVQWGKATTSSSGPVSVTFPIAFPNSCCSVTAAPYSATNGSYFNLNGIEPGLTGFRASIQNSAASWIAGSVHWIAIGY